MRNIAKNIAERNGVDVNEAYKRMVNFSQSAAITGGITASIPGDAAKVNILSGKVGVDGKIGAENITASESSAHHGVGRSMDITAEEASRFSKDLHKVQEYSKTHYADTNHSKAESQLFQLSNNLNKAQSASESYSVHKAESERLNNTASLIRQHSGQVDSDLNQEFSEYVTKAVGREQAESMFGGKDRVKLEAIANDYSRSSGVESKILSNYQNNSSGINPDQKAQVEYERINAKSGGIIAAHEQQSQGLVANAKAENVELKKKAEDDMFKASEFDQVKDNANKSYNKLSDDLKKDGIASKDKYNKLNTEVSADIKNGTERSKNITGDIRPEFAEK